MPMEGKDKVWMNVNNVKFCKVPWDDNGGSVESWRERLATINESVMSFLKGDETKFNNFFCTQLAMTIFDINRMEGTVSPSLQEGATFLAILNFLEDSCEPPPPIAWNAEGGRELKAISTQRQLYQFTKAAVFLLKENVHTPLSSDLIKATYRIMMENSFHEDTKGKQTMLKVDDVRDSEVFAGFFQFAPASAVRRCLQGLCAAYNQMHDNMRTHEDCDSIHPISAATFLFFELITTHPFLNGNGRLCRLFLAWSLMRDGFPFPVSYSTGHKKRRQHYLHAIETARVDPTGHRGELNAILVVSLERVLRNYKEMQRQLRNASNWDAGIPHAAGSTSTTGLEDI